MSKSGWTVDTLKEHLDKLMSVLVDQRNIAAQDMHREISATYATLEERLTSLSELRLTVISRAEYNTAHEALEDKLTALTDRFNTEVAGRRQGGNALWGYIVAGLTVTAAVVTVVILLVVHG